MTIGFVITLFAIGLFFGFIAILGLGFQTIAEERALADKLPSADPRGADKQARDDAGFFGDEPPTVEHTGEVNREQVASEVQEALSRELRLSARLADDPEALYSEHNSH